mgnify:CR=1 FL=1
MGPEFGKMSLIGSITIHFIKRSIDLDFVSKNSSMPIFCQFGLYTLFIFTAVNIYCLPLLRIDRMYWESEALRSIVVLCLMVMMHILQFTLWMNPGPCYETLAELSFDLGNLSMAEMLLIDLNGLISVELFRDEATRILLLMTDKMRQWR